MNNTITQNTILARRACITYILNLSSSSVPKLRYEPLTLHIKMFSINRKITQDVKCDNINNLCLCLKQEQTCQIIQV